ncbi:MAG: DUF934 domain-containing protein, partial [Polynucleobacter sp.]
MFMLRSVSHQRNLWIQFIVSVLRHLKSVCMRRLNVPKLIRYPKHGQAQLAANDWQVFRSTEGEESAALMPGKVIVPFSWWTSHGAKEQYQARSLKGEIAVWFAPEDDVLAHQEVILAGMKFWPILAIDFPVFRDGRGYSTAALLRERFGWEGELRAIGDVLIDQLLP